MIKITLVKDQRGLGGPLRFEDATTWRVTNDGTVVIKSDDTVFAEVMIQHVLFIEREEDEEEEGEEG